MNARSQPRGEVLTPKYLTLTASQLLLLSLLVLSFGLNLWGINFGLPYTYQVDEGALVMPAVNIFRTGDFRPLRLDYGSAYIYSLVALYVPYFLYGRWQGSFTSVADWPVYVDYHTIGRYPVPAAFLIGRLFTAALGSLSVFMVYRLGQRLAGKQAGLIAAAFLAILPLYVTHSHYARTDVPMACLVLIGLFYILNVFDYGRWPDYAWAGFWVGLAASTRYPAALAIGALLVAHVLRIRMRGIFIGHLTLGLVAAVVGFLIGTPYALLDPPYFWHWFTYMSQGYQTGSDLPGPLFYGPSWSLYLKEIFWKPSSLILVPGVLGLIGFIRRDWQRGVICALFPLTYLAIVSMQTLHYVRILVSVLPFFALGAGIAVTLLAEKIANRWPSFQLRPSLLLVALSVMLGLYPLSQSLLWCYRLAGPDLRTEALAWYSANISPEAKVAADPSGPSLTAVSHNVHLTWDFTQHEPDWYVDQNFEYLVISEGLLKNPNLTLRAANGYQQLASRFPLVKTFTGVIMGLENMHIWIYQVTPAAPAPEPG